MKKFFLLLLFSVIVLTAFSQQSDYFIPVNFNHAYENETKYAWMDEGFTSYGESLIATALDTVDYARFYFQEIFKDNIGYDCDMPLFASSEYVLGEVYNFNSYPKAAIFFSMLHEYLGDEAFLKALHTFVDRWKGKHPTPHDFIFTFEDIAGESLSWFIKPWIFDYGDADFSIENSSATEIVISKNGHYPAPIEVEIRYTDGTSETERFDAGIWKTGNTTFILLSDLDKQIARGTLTNVVGLDINPGNNSIFFNSK